MNLFEQEKEKYISIFFQSSELLEEMNVTDVTWDISDSRDAAAFYGNSTENAVSIDYTVVLKGNLKSKTLRSKLFQSVKVGSIVSFFIVSPTSPEGFLKFLNKYFWKIENAHRFKTFKITKLLTL